MKEKKKRGEGKRMDDTSQWIRKHQKKSVQRMDGLGVFFFLLYTYQQHKRLTCNADFKKKLFNMEDLFNNCDGVFTRFPFFFYFLLYVAHVEQIIKYFTFRLTSKLLLERELSVSLPTVVLTLTPSWTCLLNR